MNRSIVTAVVAFALLGSGVAPEHALRAESRKERQRKKIEDLSEKIERRLKVRNPSKENVFLHERAAVLLVRLMLSREDSYRFDRLARATDALLEASERIFDAREKDRDDDDDDDRRKTALDLQRDYFRLQQAQYFARQSGEKDAKLYVKCARAIYQQARRAFDAQTYEKAETLGDAASYIVRALENLAQAAIRVPEPPRL